MQTLILLFQTDGQILEAGSTAYNQNLHAHKMNRYARRAQTDLLQHSSFGLPTGALTRALCAIGVSESHSNPACGGSQSLIRVSTPHTLAQFNRVRGSPSCPVIIVVHNLHTETIVLTMAWSQHHCLTSTTYCSENVVALWRCAQLYADHSNSKLMRGKPSGRGVIPHAMCSCEMPPVQ